MECVRLDNRAGGIGNEQMDTDSPRTVCRFAWQHPYLDPASCHVFLICLYASVFLHDGHVTACA